MANSIKINVLSTGKSYVLQFNRRIIVEMEAEGLLKKLQSLSNQGEENTENIGEALKTIYRFIYFAFKKNQPTITQQETDEIIDEIGDITGLVEALVDILEKSINAVDKEHSGNAIWERA